MARGQRQLHHYRLFCSVCKTTFVYREYAKADAMKKFSACGHDDKKVRRLARNVVFGFMRT